MFAFAMFMSLCSCRLRRSSVLLVPVVLECQMGIS